MKNTIKSFFSILLISFVTLSDIIAEDGYQLWLRYNKIDDRQVLNSYINYVKYIVIDTSSPELMAASEELEKGLAGLFGKPVELRNDITDDGALLVCTVTSSGLTLPESVIAALKDINNDGYIIQTLVLKQKKVTVITANKPIGALYGTFHFLRLLQAHADITRLNISESPEIKIRILNHWDNLDRTVERGYAGFSIWDWHKLPDYIDPQYIDYARANASIGINGTVLTNVNANAFVLTEQYIHKVAALADVFRKYGIKVYLTARFSSPIEIGGLKTADPLDTGVINWWKAKVNEIYKAIPDFGGFLVKANSEGQPGPQNYGRSHADGANMLADALAPHGGIVMWRAFVYSNELPDDRAKQAYNEFKPLDGQFRDNVLIQVKNGPIDFQPREPFHPLFGAMPQTSLAMEFQITQEYLGQGTHLVYLAPLYKECLESDTYAAGKGSIVAKIIDGSTNKNKYTAIAGVANIGTNRNWTGHQFGQANWYAFGRLGWNHELTSEQIADEWIRMTFCNSPNTVETIKQIMLMSRDAAVNYMTPLGLHHIMGWNHHYGPAPWINEGRADWTSVYYHKADSAGIGFERTSKGSYALAQYAPEVDSFYSNLSTCPDSYLLWFHHLPWNYSMKSGNALWDELCFRYANGVKSVINMNALWNSLQRDIDPERFEQVKAFLLIQQKEAVWWRNACLLYFQKFSGLPIPAGIEKPQGILDDYMKQRFPYAPGIKPSW